MWPQLLQYEAARHVLGLATGDELVRCADSLLNAGVYTQSLGDLFTLPSWEIGWKAPPLFRKALAELGRRVPSDPEAAATVFQYYVVEVVEGRLSPRASVDGFMSEYWSLWDRHQLFECARDWIAHSYAYEEIDAYHQGPGRERQLLTIDNEVLRNAHDWLREREVARFKTAWLNWNDATVPRMARRIAAEHLFGDLPILADAIEEAGCPDEEVLIHLRSAGPHPRTCWIVELLVSN